MNYKIIIPTLLKRARIYLRGLRMKIDPRRKIIGSASWLVTTEIKYGGRVIRVPRRKVSPYDPRTQEQIAYRGDSGGDRMLYNGYAEKYAEYLRSFIQNNNARVIVEVGILKGTGLAIWSELFPQATVFGLDIDPSRFFDNEQDLISRGAFKQTRPCIHTFDQFVHNGSLLEKILDGQKIDICIDDGFHSNETILNTFEDMVPFLANNFVYFIEDNRQVHLTLRQAWPDMNIVSAGLLTIVTRGK